MAKKNINKHFDKNLKNFIEISIKRQFIQSGQNPIYLNCNLSKFIVLTVYRWLIHRNRIKISMSVIPMIYCWYTISTSPFQFIDIFRYFDQLIGDKMFYKLAKKSLNKNVGKNGHGQFRQYRYLSIYWSTNKGYIVL